jgi:short-subunit dehydrogenase
MSSPQPLSNSRPLVVTGASSGIGYELAKRCASEGVNLVLAADEPLEPAAEDFRALGATVETVQADLASPPRNDLKDSGVSVTCLIPGATDTGCFERAGLEGTRATRTILPLSRRMASPR